MPWRGAERPGEFPTLGYLVASWIQAKCAIPDGDFRGDPFVLTDEQLRLLLFHYRINPSARYDKASGRWRGAWVYDRGSRLTRPQKWGKAPIGSAVICSEAAPDGPVLFDGWDANGEPVGRPWPTPWIQVTAISEAQTDNVWDALLPMIELGALAADLPDTGATKINLPHGGKIEPVTSSAQSRRGQRITFALQDETDGWTAENGGRKVADTQRRNLAGTGGRFLETNNAWDPREDSVAQQTAEGGEPGVYHDDVEPGTGSIRNKRERRRILRKVYGDSWWVDLDRVDSEIEALLNRDAAQAERHFFNRKRASEDAAFDADAWKKRFRALTIPKRSVIVVGVDGARFVDALAMVATHVKSGYQWPLGIWERPENAPDEYEHPADAIDGALIEAEERWSVWRVYIDPQWIDHLLDRWQGRWGQKRVVPWYTNRPRQVAWAVRSYTEAITAGGDFSHNGDPTFTRQIKNARKQKVSVYDDKHRQMHTISKERPDSPLKIDAAMAGVISREARGDAIAAGATSKKSRKLVTF